MCLFIKAIHISNVYKQKTAPHINYLLLGNYDPEHDCLSTFTSSILGPIWKAHILLQLQNFCYKIVIFHLNSAKLFFLNLPIFYLEILQFRYEKVFPNRPLALK